MTRLDFDPRQYRLLLGLLSDLGSRQEITSQMGLSRGAVTMAADISAFVGALVSLIALTSPAATTSWPLR